MIDYTPLKISMVKLGITFKDLREQLGISTRTAAKFNANEYVSMRVIEDICITYNLPIEQVVQITQDPSEMLDEH